MKRHNHKRGFTLIELMLVLAIAAILAAMAGSTLLRAMPRMRIRSDSWAIYHAITKAKYLTINENRSFGVALYHPGGALPDSCWVFKDWDDDELYDDIANGPYRQCNPAVDTACAEDPIAGSVIPLDATNFYRLVFSTDMSADGAMVIITFTPLGGVRQMGKFGANTVLIQSRSAVIQGGAKYSYQGGIKLDFASGISSLLPTVRVPLP